VLPLTQLLFTRSFVQCQGITNLVGLSRYGGGPVGVPDKATLGDFDIVSTSTIDLAQQKTLERDRTFPRRYL
jgi:hypothetical protein